MHGLRDELASLEEAKAHPSPERRRLHQQIDNGYASESTRASERQVSDQRLELHRRIAALRERLGVTEESVVASSSDWMGRGFSRLENPHVFRGEGLGD